MDNNNQNEADNTSYVFKSENTSTGCDNGIPVEDIQELNSSHLMNGAEYEFYEISNGQSLSLNDEALSNNILMESIGPVSVVNSDNNSNFISSEQNQVVELNNSEECEKVVRHVEGEIIGVFDSTKLSSRPQMIFNQEDQKDIIEMIETYNNSSYDAFSIQNSDFVDSAHTEMFINETDEKNNITVFGDTENSQKSNMLYYSEDSNNLTEEGEGVDIASRSLNIKRVLTNKDANMTDITESESFSRNECTVFNVISSIGPDQTPDTKTQLPSVQNEVLIYSTDPTTENIFGSTLTEKNAEIIEVLDSVGFSTNPKFALLDEDGNIVGLLHSDSQLKEIEHNTTGESYNITQSPPEETVLNIDNINQKKSTNSYKKMRQSGKLVKESKGVSKSQRRLQKQINQSKRFEPQSKVISCTERKESWSNDVPNQPAPTPEILVLHPLRTRRLTARRNIENNNSPIINRNVEKSIENCFDRMSITVPLIGHSHVQGRRRKQKISQLKEAKCYVNGEFHLESTQTSKTYFDRYAFDSDIPEINEIFSRKKKVIANNKDIEVKSDPSHLNTFCDVKNAPIRKRLEFTTETESSDEEPHYKAEVGKSLKCTKCSKIFKSSRSVSIHNKFCKAKSCESHIPVESPKNDKYILKESNGPRLDSENKDLDKKPFESPLLRKRKLTTRSHTKPQVVKRRA